jgi:hypothetical protein
MRGMIARREVRVGLAACVATAAFAAAASIGGAVSPAGLHASAHQYQYGKKVTICHRTGSKKHPFVTIRVAKSAVKAHLRHGDKLGPCKRAKFVVCHKSRWGKGKHALTVRGTAALRRHLGHGDRVGRCKSGHHKPTSKHRGKGSKKGHGR